MKKTRSIGIIDINAPVLLSLAFLSLACYAANYLSGGWLNGFLAARFTSFLDPLMYLRLFTHVFAHADLPHYINNFLLLLVVGPAVEEKYGSRRVLVLLGITAVVCALPQILIFQNVALMGASGLVFMMIILASFTNVRERKIPLTFLLVAVYYIGGEVVSGITAQDNISQLAHILGGVCGAVFGFAVRPAKK